MVLELTFTAAYAAILLTCLAGLIFGIINGWMVLSIDTSKLPEGYNDPQPQPVLNDEEKDRLNASSASKREPDVPLTQEKIDILNITAEKIQSVI